ncbi:MAG TPA: FHA domain-containing protein [Kofleriaceae bacterium]|nr:FHA domain-containing protein [Kofleriaceae bacterium]
MGKDIDACCEACRHASDEVVELDTPVLRGPQSLWLTVTRGGKITREIPLHRGATRVGRGQQCEIQLDDSALSRVQCTFEISDAGVTVTDNGSTCGTYVDGHRVDRGVLRDGSWVLVGNCYLRVVAR